MKQLLKAFFLEWTVSEPMIPEHSEDKNSRYKRDEGGSIASRVHLFEVGEVRRLKWKRKQTDKIQEEE